MEFDGTPARRMRMTFVKRSLLVKPVKNRGDHSKIKPSPRRKRRAQSSEVLQLAREKLCQIIRKLCRFPSALLAPEVGGIVRQHEFYC